MRNDAPRVLIIEDDAHQLDLLTLITRRQRPHWRVRTQLANAGWVDAVANGEAPGAPADLLLVDSFLSGVEALSLMDNLCLAGPVVLMCGTGRTIIEERWRSAGVVAAVGKPYDLVEANRLLRVCDAFIAEADDAKGVT